MRADYASLVSDLPESGSSFPDFTDLHVNPDSELLDLSQYQHGHRVFNVAVQRMVLEFQTKAVPVHCRHGASFFALLDSIYATCLLHCTFRSSIADSGRAGLIAPTCGTFGSCASTDRESRLVLGVAARDLRRKVLSSARSTLSLRCSAFLDSVSFLCSSSPVSFFLSAALLCSFLLLCSPLFLSSALLCCSFLSFFCSSPRTILRGIKLDAKMYV